MPATKFTSRIPCRNGSNIVTIALAVGLTIASGIRQPAAAAPAPPSLTLMAVHSVVPAFEQTEKQAIDVETGTPEPALSLNDETAYAFLCCAADGTLACATILGEKCPSGTDQVACPCRPTQE